MTTHRNIAMPERARSPLGSGAWSLRSIAPRSS